MKVYKAIDGFILTLKILSVVIFTIIFLYWSINATIKLKSQPTVSTVAYKFGDDGQGNFQFPAITICQDTFDWMTLSPGMKGKCSRTKGKSIQHFYEALKSCTAKNDQSSTDLSNDAKSSDASDAASGAISGDTSAASNAAYNTASNDVSDTAFNDGSNDASNTAFNDGSNYASNDAFNDVSNYASNDASNAAFNDGSNYASNNAFNDVSNAGNNAASNDASNAQAIGNHFQKLEDLLNITKKVEITDIVSWFMFAEGNEKNITARSDNNKEMILMKELWEPTLHFERGLCYTFDPKLHGKFQADPDNLLSINITFDVSSVKGNFLIV